MMRCEMDRCHNVTVPKDVTDCAEPSVSCAECEYGYSNTEDAEGKYCGKVCDLEDCITAVSQRGTTDCRTPFAVQCRECASGKAAYDDEKGSYCGLKCPSLGDFPNCRSLKVPRGTQKCSDAICAECEPNYELSINDKYEFTGQCNMACTDKQVESGCEKNSCTSSTRCNKCVTPYRHDPGDGTCHKATQPKQMTFYMYRASRSVSYHPENIDLASAAGVLFYLHNEVARVSCDPRPGRTGSFQRHYDISRVIRYKVTAKNTMQVFQKDGKQRQFGKFVQFDSGQCTAGAQGAKSCAKENWAPYGFMVGCQPAALCGTPAEMAAGKAKPCYETRFSNSYWYSLPGRCPSRRYNDPKKSTEDALMRCVRKPLERGGECPKPPCKKWWGCMPQPAGDPSEFPTGADDCTWRLEEAGEVSLDEMTGIDRDYGGGCSTPGCAYDKFCAPYLKEPCLSNKQDESCPREYDCKEATFAGKPDRDPCADCPNKGKLLCEDHGVGTDYWNNKTGLLANEERTRILLKRFADKYGPGSGQLDPKICGGEECPYISDPICDWD